jgi:hypothetical protein
MPLTRPFVGTGFAFAADPLEESENQVTAPAPEWHNGETSEAEQRLAAAKLVRLSRALSGIVHELNRSLANHRLR